MSKLGSFNLEIRIPVSRDKGFRVRIKLEIRAEFLLADLNGVDLGIFRYSNIHLGGENTRIERIPDIDKRIQYFEFPNALHKLKTIGEKSFWIQGFTYDQCF